MLKAVCYGAASARLTGNPMQILSLAVTVKYLEFKSTRSLFRITRDPSIHMGDS